MRRIFAALILAFWMTPGVAAIHLPTPPPLSPEEVYRITQEAYIFTYPLVMNYHRMYLQAISPHSRSFAGGFGRWKHNLPATPSFKSFPTPETDLAYSWAWVDLRQEPWIVTLPRMAKYRYYSSQWDDLWGFIVGNQGSIRDGNQGGTYMLIGPHWRGRVPPGVKRLIRSETDFVGCLVRTEDLGGAERLEEIQSGFKLLSLSNYLHRNPPPPLPKIEWPEWTDEAETTDKFFTYANFILSYVKPNYADQAILHRIALLGIGAGKPWDPEEMDPTLRQAMQAGIDAARALLDGRVAKAPHPSAFFGTRRTIGGNYLNRAIGIHAHHFASLSNENFHLPWSADAHGDYLDSGKYNYKITFPAGSLPPVNYFWSLAVYSLPDHRLVANPIDRYSLSSHGDRLKKSPDGSITIYLQENSPGKDKEANWLPTPYGPFYAVLHAYGPRSSLVRGGWERPEIEVMP